MNVTVSMPSEDVGRAPAPGSRPGGTSLCCRTGAATAEAANISPLCRCTDAELGRCRITALLLDRCIVAELGRRGATALLDRCNVADGGCRVADCISLTSEVLLRRTAARMGALPGRLAAAIRCGCFGCCCC